MGFAPAVDLLDRHQVGDDTAAPVLPGVLCQPGIFLAADIVAHFFLIGNLCFFSIRAVEALSFQKIHAVLHHIICSGVAACPLTVEAHNAGAFPPEGDKIIVGRHGGLQRSFGKQGGLDTGADAGFPPGGCADELADHAVLRKGCHILCKNFVDAADGNLLPVHADSEGHIGREDGLVPGVDALHIGGGVGLRIAQRLRLLQSLAVIQTQPGHGVQNIVAGAVHNAPNLLQLLRPAAALQLAEPADAAAHCGGAAEGKSLLLCQRHQLIIEGGHQSLVGGDDMLAGLHGGADKLIGRVQAAHGLHHGVDGIVIQDALKIPGHFRIGQRHILKAHHLGYLHILPGGGQLINTPTHHAEAQQSDPHTFFLSFPCLGRKVVSLPKTLAF